MKHARLAACVAVAAIFGLTTFRSRGQQVRRAQPTQEPRVQRALPPDDEASPKPRLRETTPAPQEAQRPVETPPPEPEESADKRQLDYANGLFARKQYDLAIPEYEKYLGQFPKGAGRAAASFYLGESYRALNKTQAAKTSFLAVVEQHGESEFAAPAAYGAGEILFTQKDYNGALKMFHLAASRSHDPPLTLSARYFEARCLEALDRKDEAIAAYQQVIDAKGANPYREDSRLAAATLATARGRKIDALRNYEALANETGKPALKAEATVRAGLLAVELIQPEKGKVDQGMAEKALILLQKGRTLPEAGKWHAIAEVGLLRLQYQLGQFDKVIAEYNKNKDAVPEDTRAEMMLMVANCHRQLGHTQEADDAYRQLIEKYPGKEEAKDAQYQRLINFYNAGSPSFLTEADQYLQSNPSAERADQAKLLKAEYYYKKQQFTEAATLYAELRASQLSPKLRAEAAYKLGWCYAQLKDNTRLIEAFTYFLKAFPDSPQVPSALLQRAIAYQEQKNYDAAIADFDGLLKSYPKLKEREFVLQQKALILAEKQNLPAMADTFRQLLKEFPKTAAAAQANYHIGRAAFDQKDYKGAIGPLDTARKLNKEQYGGVATTRILVALLNLKDRAALTREVDAVLAANNVTVPPEVLYWLGLEYYGENNYQLAERYLAALAKSDNLGNVKPEFWFYLAEAESHLQKYAEADTAYQRYLQVAQDPAAKAKVLLALGATKIAEHKPDEAQRIAEEIMQLQPEGKVNAEARLLLGDVQMERQHYEEAGKAYMGVALLYDDPAITPRALRKAAAAYDKAGRKDLADRANEQLRAKYPNLAGG